jgi:hypothetical protein
MATDPRAARGKTDLHTCEHFAQASSDNTQSLCGPREDSFMVLESAHETCNGKKGVLTQAFRNSLL